MHNQQGFLAFQKFKKDATEEFMSFLIIESSYETSMGVLAPFFQNLPGANNETNTQDARKAIRSLSLDDNEQIVSLDVKSLYTNVPVVEYIKTALRELYSGNLTPENAIFEI